MSQTTSLTDRSQGRQSQNAVVNDVGAGRSVAARVLLERTEYSAAVRARLLPVMSALSVSNAQIAENQRPLSLEIGPPITCGCWELLAVREVSEHRNRQKADSTTFAKDSPVSRLSRGTRRSRFSSMAERP